jgi:Bacterial alpha-L-rhamnosidase 6 hairpin glycosidase domain
MWFSLKRSPALFFLAGDENNLLLGGGFRMVNEFDSDQDFLPNEPEIKKSLLARLFTGIASRIIGIIVRKFGVERAFAFLNSSSKLGRPSPVAYPIELALASGQVATRGFYNYQFFQTNRDWVFPFWAERQMDPNAVAFIPRAFSLIQNNLTYRNWTMIGRPGTEHEAVVDPRGLLTPQWEDWSIDVWLSIEDQLFCPSQLDEVVQQLTNNNMPCINTSWEAQSIEVLQEAICAEVAGRDFALTRISLTNKSEKAIDCSLFVSIRPFNGEGAALINKLAYIKEGFWEINGKLGPILQQIPNATFTSNLENGDVAFTHKTGKSNSEITDPAGMANGANLFGLRLGAGQTAQFVALAPIEPTESDRELIDLAKQADFEALKSDMLESWRSLLAGRSVFTIPEKKFADSVRAIKTHLLMADDGDHICPGPMTYHHYWFRDSAYEVIALLKMGHPERAREKLVNYPSRQRKDGYFLSQNGEWDANGQAIWPILEYWRHTGDDDFVREMYPAIRRGVDWIENNRVREVKRESPFYGLLPAGFSAEHLGANDYYYWDDFWCLAGVREARLAAEIVGESEDAHRFDNIYNDFRNDIEKSLANAAQRLGTQAMPAAPLRRPDSGMIGNIVSYWPLKLMDAEDPRLIDTVEEIRRVSFWKNGFFQHMIHSGVNCYLTLHIAQCLLGQRSQQAWSLARFLLDIARSTFTWPEAVNPRTLGGSMGDGHHIWAAADWLMFMRNALFFEENERLIVTPALPTEWLDDGAEVGITNAPSHFGDVSFMIRRKASEVTLEFEGNLRPNCKEIEWNLPLPFDLVPVIGLTKKENAVVFSPSIKSATVKLKES